MMENLNRMAVFATVVSEGSLAAAGRRLGISASAVSQHLRQLETAVGVPLLHRSTRKLTLTDAGAAFFPGCEAMLGSAREAEQRLAEMRDTLSGELRISSTVGIGGKPLCEALTPLLQQHPGLQLRIIATDQVLDMIEHRIDIALRVNRQLNDTTIIAHQLVAWPLVVCASPRYLSLHGVPETPEDLIAHRWITGMPASGVNARNIELHHSHYPAVRLRIAEGQVISDSMSVIRDFTLAGQGISLQPLYEIQDKLRSGELMLLLPEWRPASLRLTALTLERVLPEKTRQALQVLRDYFQRIDAATLAERG
ncbi:DNA-binding transcriptional LysR family regulator [Erwinia toletana]|uniref:DNA-binding transcriptional LysR family regulator n=2 Tax=Winslowiella toletana TaxID=92490 RepID=A0ABS4PF29_9GAMM|nr:LysR substrate-binding domain-containing protein [Winslowiella toletana]MBP2171246.1 DNA-binding transcriptional LysR family regulator [Winslowiella toletana]